MRGRPASGVRRVARERAPEDSAIARFVRYEPETGEFFWAVTRGSNAMAGSRAGSVWTSPRGEKRYVIRFGRRGYQGNRVAYLIMTGKWPDHLVDHEDGDTLNNRWANLREAAHHQNAANARVRKDNRLGLKGVSFHKGKGKFIARIQVEKSRLTLGAFETAEAAYAAYCEAGTRLAGQFFNQGVSR